MQLVDRWIGAAFAAAGTSGLLHARDLSTGREVSHCADEPVVLASVFKIPVLVAYCRSVAAGRLDARARTRVTDRDRIGGVGTAGCADDVEMSWRDLALFMMSMSDNAATDTILDAVGLSAVQAVLDDAGLVNTVIAGGCRDLFAQMRAGFGLGPDGDLDAAVAASSITDLMTNPALDPVTSTHRSTPREITSLLAHLWDAWSDDLAAAAARDMMAKQAWEHRLASGFDSDIEVAGKTGTLPLIRNEAGVITYPDGRQYALAVFTRTDTSARRLPAVDGVIGRAARLAVDALRTTATGQSF